MLPFMFMNLPAIRPINDLLALPARSRDGRTRFKIVTVVSGGNAPTTRGGIACALQDVNGDRLHTKSKMHQTHYAGES